MKKKLLTLALGAMLLGFAAPSYAGTAIAVSGGCGGGDGWWGDWGWSDCGGWGRGCGGCGGGWGDWGW
ncbi:MAG: hypothetical protein PHW76_03640 [Alphaproteobacteria bacterium]|nr:hypothetical protein [Alphaproteobacteria bacterium]